MGKNLLIIISTAGERKSINWGFICCKCY